MPTPTPHPQVTDLANQLGLSMLAVNLTRPYDGSVVAAALADAGLELVHAGHPKP